MNVGILITCRIVECTKYEVETRFFMTMNGYQSESEDNSPKPHQICCLVEDKERCKRLAGNACYSKRIQKTVAQKKLKLASADNVGLRSFVIWQNLCALSSLVSAFHHLY